VNPVLKKILLALGAMFFLLLILEGTSSVVLSCTGQQVRKDRNNPLQGRKGVVNVFQFDEELGWRYRPDTHSPDYYGEGISMTTNSRGMRSTQEHTGEIPEGKYRVICLGDSFTMGWGVSDDETFPHFMEESTETIEAVNMGCGAYGAQQCYLWYLRDGLELETDVLLLCVINDDFRRMAPRNKSTDGTPRPIVDVHDGELQLTRPMSARKVVSKRNPVIRFLKDLSIYRLLLSWARQSYDRKSVAEAHFAPASEAMFRDLARRSRERSQKFYLVYLPSLWELPDRSRLLNTWLREFLKEEGIGLIDLSTTFAALSPSERRTLYLPDSHFSVYGTRMASKGIIEGLRRLDSEFSE